MAKLTDNAIKVLERRYLQKDEKDLTKVIETPEDLFRRVAHTVAQADAKDFIKTDDTEISVTEYVKDTEDTFFNMLNNLEFLPNSPTLMNAGRRLGQLSACFVLPVNNTVEEILKTIKNTAIIHKSGGGTGFNFSHVKLDPVLPASYRPIFVLSGLHTDIDSFKAAEFSHCDKWALPDSIIEFPYDDSYVVIDDNMESIFTLDVLLKQPKYIIFSKVRPAKSIVHATNGEASGPVSFMSVWNEAVRFLTNQITPITTIRLMNMCTEVVKQGGTRRGANMGIVNADCEYIEEFVNCKEDNDEINNFNLSVGIVDGFWKSYINNTSAVDQSKKVVWGLKNYATGDMVRAIDPVTFMNNVIDHAWCNGEPGIIFLDKINAKNPIKTMQVESTNPCGEQPLLPYEACNLGSINLKEMLTVENGKYVLDEAKLENTVYSAVHFLDNVIEVNKYPIPEIDATTRKFRKIGLGVMAWADMLYLMNIAYNSDEAIKMAKRVSGLIQEYAHKASETLGMIRGSFSGILETIYSDDPNISYMRNATTTTIAPTGTISIIASVSSGIEPQFAISYIRIAMDEDELAYVNPIFKNALLKATGWTEQDDIYKQVMIKVAKEGSVVHIDEIPEEIKRVFVTAHDIDVSWHIQHQAAWQENTDNAVSKTINMLNSATREDVREAYNLARSTNCKGTTIYRDGSRESQVLNVGSKKEKNDHTTKTITETIPRALEEINTTANKLKETDITFQQLVDKVTPVTQDKPSEKKTLNDYTHFGIPSDDNFTHTERYIAPQIPRPRPEITTGFTQKVKIGCGNLYVTVNYDEEGVCEVFTNTGRAGGCPSQSEATARLVSLALRSGIPTDAIVAQLKGIRCPSTIRQKGINVLSCPDAIGRMIEKVEKMLISNTNNITPELDTTDVEDTSDDESCGNSCATCSMTSTCNKVNEAPQVATNPGAIRVCPECGKEVEHEGGCVVCRNCGYSKCG